MYRNIVFCEVWYFTGSGLCWLQTGPSSSDNWQPVWPSVSSVIQRHGESGESGRVRGGNIKYQRLHIGMFQVLDFIIFPWLSHIWWLLPVLDWLEVKWCDLTNSLGIIDPVLATEEELTAHCSVRTVDVFLCFLYISWLHNLTKCCSLYLYQGIFLT